MADLTRNMAATFYAKAVFAIFASITKLAILAILAISTILAILAILATPTFFICCVLACGGAPPNTITGLAC